MENISEEDISFCWQQVLGRDPWFRLHHQFAPEKQALPILALHALFAMLDRVLDMSEESLSVTQLMWWKSELGTDGINASAHPVVNTLRQSVQPAVISDEISGPLIEQCFLRIEGKPVSDEIQLKQLCHTIGNARIAAEFALVSGQLNRPAYSGCGAGTGLACLFEFLFWSRQPSWWFVPLNLLAKHRLERNGIKALSQEAVSVLSKLTQLGSSWFEEQSQDLVMFCQNNLSLGGTGKHLLASTACQRLRFNYSVNDFVQGGCGEAGRWRISDLLRVWSASRRVHR